MSVKQRRLMLAIGLALLIVGGSMYFARPANEETTVAYQGGLLDMNSVAAHHDGQLVVVYVSGGVNKPGVVKVPATSRVIDVINAAGGLAAGASVDNVNLAQKVVDGMHIKVPVMLNNQQAESFQPAKGAKVSINRATEQELDSLPGIGPALARRIVEYRQTNGPFKELADLKKVPGIGEAKFRQIENMIDL